MNNVLCAAAFALAVVTAAPAMAEIVTGTVLHRTTGGNCLSIQVMVVDSDNPKSSLVGLKPWFQLIDNALPTGTVLVPDELLASFINAEPMKIIKFTTFRKPNAMCTPYGETVNDVATGVQQ